MSDVRVSQAAGRPGRRRGRPACEASLRKAVRAYLRGAVEHPNEPRPLDVRSVAAAVTCSPTTLYKYGFEKLIKRIAGRRKRAGGWTPRGAARAKLDLQLLAARHEAAEWKRQYTTLLERLIIIEDQLRSQAGVDLDKLYATGVRLVRRDQPASSRQPTQGALRPGPSSAP